MGIYGSRQLGHYGHMGNAFGATAFDLFTGGPGFQGADTYNNWSGASRWATSADVVNIGYTPLSTAVQHAAQTVWQNIDQSLNPADADYKERTNTALKGLINAADALAGNHSVFGEYQTSTTRALIDTFKQIQKLIKGIAVYRLQPQPTPSADPLPVTSSAHALTAGGAGASAAGGAVNVGSGDGGGSSTMLYVGLGVGVLALAAGAYFLVKKRKSVAGYRRRRRR